MKVTDFFFLFLFGLLFCILAIPVITFIEQNFNTNSTAIPEVEFSNAVIFTFLFVFCGVFIVVYTYFNQEKEEFGFEEE